MITETDHMFMRPPKNVATEEKPVGFGFYYMISTDPKPVSYTHLTLPTILLV